MVASEVLACLSIYALSGSFQAPQLVDEFGVEMKVVGIVSSSSMLLDAK